MSRSRLATLVEVALMLALSVVLSQIKILHLPQGGSVTAGSMVPILLVGLRHGWKWGVGAGIAAGLLNLLIDPFVVHPVQLLLDYPVAFGLLGLSGLAQGRSNTVAGILGSLALIGRLAAHVVSGVVFFAEYAGNQNVWVYSIVYNGSYLLPEMFISAFLLVLLLPALQRVVPVAAGNQLRKSA